MGFRDKAQCGGSTVPLLGVGVFLLLRQNQWAFILPNSKSSQVFLLCILRVGFLLFYWLILTETKGVHLLGRENKKREKKKKVSKENHRLKEAISGTTWL